MWQSLLQILNKADSSIDPSRITIISSLEKTIPLLAQPKAFPAFAFHSQLSLQKPDRFYLHCFLLIKAMVLINRYTFTQPASPLVNLACILSHFPSFCTHMDFLLKEKPSQFWNTVEVTLMFSGYSFLPFLKFCQEVCFSAVLCYQSAALLKILAAGHAISCASSFRTQGQRLSCPSNFTALSFFFFFFTSHKIISISTFTFLHLHVTFFCG